MEITSELKSEVKSKRPRAHQACERCRSRKVRCDLVSHGSPCTNCTLDGCSCVILPSTRRHPRYGGASKLEKQKKSSATGDKEKTWRGQYEKTRSDSSNRRQRTPEATSKGHGNISATSAFGDLLKATVVAYIDYIHPQVPILPLQTIRPILEDGLLDPTRSLGSFRANALVAAALPHVPQDRLKACGLKSEKDRLMATRLHLARAEVFRPALFEMKRTLMY
jgi:hypothetical protein